MKTFFNLIQEVQKPGLCCRCGGCATFCTAINYGALAINAEGKPVYEDIEKCIECGLCYSICPEITDLDEETKRQAAWSEPMGRVIETTVVRSVEPQIRDRASDGGVVTGMLLHLLERNKIDGAIVTRPVTPFQREPFLAVTAEEILDSAGCWPDSSQGLKHFSDQYMTFSTFKKFDRMMQLGLKRVALIGTPCQIKSLRKMQVLNLVPSDAIKFCFGLFCSGNLVFGEKEKRIIAELAGIEWKNINHINVKEDLILTLKSGEKRIISGEKIDPLKRYACRYCADYSNEFSDISFGGVGAQDGWTTVITRTPLGRAVLADCKSFEKIEQFSLLDNPEFASQALQAVRKVSRTKKKQARYNRRGLQKRPVQLQI